MPRRLRAPQRQIGHALVGSPRDRGLAPVHHGPVPSDLPSGTVTFLFTDIEGSTRLLERLGSEYEGVLSHHRRLIRAAVAAHDGIEVDTQGDAFLCVFQRAADAVQQTDRIVGTYLDDGGGLCGVVEHHHTRRRTDVLVRCIGLFTRQQPLFERQ